MKIAKKASRIGNHIVDSIVFFIILIIHAFVLDGLLHVIPENGSVLLGIYYFVLYFGYHFIFELTLGKTP